MRVCSVGVGLSFRRLVSVLVCMSVRVVMPCGLGRTVAAEVMIMTVGRRCDHWLGNPPLFTHFCLPCHFIVVFVAQPLRMSREALQRRLIHVARERNRGIAHAQRTRITRLLAHRWYVTVLMAIAARSNGE